MDADANPNTNANANVDAGDSTIALCEHCSGELKSVDPDQTAPRSDPAPQSDLGLHCLPRPVCPNI